MESKNKIFQPKVIIGSITSFFVAAVGIIAVFFPNLLNLEKSSMSEGQFLLSDDTKTHKKLWEFLDKNQGKVVQLEIAYCADFERMTFAAVKDAKANWWYGDEFLSFRAIDFIPKWYFGFDGKTDFQSYGFSENLEKFAKQYKLALTYYETLGKPEKIEKDFGEISTKYSYVNDRWASTGNGYPLFEKTFKTEYIGRPPVIAGKIASFNIFHYGNDIYPNVIGANIENGGIGFAFKDEGLKSKDILISHPSNKNKKYIWVMGFEYAVYKYLDKTSSLAKQAKKTCKGKTINASSVGEDEVKEELLKGWGGLPLGYIKGTFYIHEKEEVGDSPGIWMATSWNNFGMLETEDYSREKFELEPFDKKDIELRKY